MSVTKQLKCSICGQPIKTTMGAIAMRQAPLVCRRCFGTESYAQPARGASATIGADISNADG
jgi:ribosome-binding protein aMBF1 (putative translation factor)